MSNHEKIDYVEFPCRNLAAAKLFFSDVFGWQFQDYGPEYSAFSGAGLDGGFFLSDRPALTANGSALVVFYSTNLEETELKITDNGGKIIRPIFSFPGGRRFHFTDPSGNEFSVWSDKGA